MKGSFDQYFQSPLEHTGGLQTKLRIVVLMVSAHID